MIFQRLRQSQLDWAYHFPKLSLVDLRPLRESLMRDEGDSWEDYSPESALAKEREEQDRRRQLAELRRKMDEDYARGLGNARSGPPPRTVIAYKHVYERWPLGWPPGEMDVDSEGG